MSNASVATSGLAQEMKSSWGWLLALGIIFVVGGIFAIFAPGAASLAVTLVVAIVFAWLGVMQIIQAFSVRSWGGFIWQLLIGIVLLAGGLIVYFNPLAGTAFLTLVVAAMFIVKGVIQLILGFQMRPHAGWGWMVASGILAIVVGVLIWRNWPISALWALGTLAGISLIFSGWTYIFLSMAVRRPA